MYHEIVLSPAGEAEHVLICSASLRSGEAMTLTTRARVSTTLLRGFGAEVRPFIGR